MPEDGVIALAGLLEAFSPISLEEMDAVRLMNRVDTKYLTDSRTLRAVLADAAAAGYRVLTPGGARISPYDTIYFDTPGLRMFSDHHNRRLRRQKVRTRAYVTSGDAFLEIKRKNNRGRTKKKRTAIPMADLPDFRANDAACRYLAGHSDFEQAGRTRRLSHEGHPPGPPGEDRPDQQILHRRHPHRPVGPVQPVQGEGAAHRKDHQP